MMSDLHDSPPKLANTAMPHTTATCRNRRLRPLPIRHDWQSILQYRLLLLFCSLEGMPWATLCSSIHCLMHQWAARKAMVSRPTGEPDSSTRTQTTTSQVFHAGHHVKRWMQSLEARCYRAHVFQPYMNRLISHRLACVITALCRPTDALSTRRDAQLACTQPTDLNP